MSQLTSEEREFVDQQKAALKIVHSNPQIRSVAWASDEKYIAIIDRLVKENEELVNERASLNSIICGLEDESRDRLGDKIRLTNRLNELLSAVEPIDSIVEVLKDWSGDYLAHIKLGDLRNLSTIAAGIRGGKG